MTRRRRTVKITQTPGHGKSAIDKSSSETVILDEAVRVDYPRLFRLQTGRVIVGEAHCGRISAEEGSTVADVSYHQLDAVSVRRCNQWSVKIMESTTFVITYLRRQTVAVEPE